MDIYLKPTDSKRFFSFKSYNSKHCLKDIPFSLVRRICMIIEKDFLKEIKSNTFTRAAIPRKNYKSKCKQIFTNTTKRIKKCKRKTQNQKLTFYFKF